jgi:glycosyltransferase involved in cell wall biosynthesis
MQADLANAVVSGRRTQVFAVPGAVSAQRCEALQRLTPALVGANILFIGHGPSGWRVRYKGLDLLLLTLKLVLAQRPDAHLTILGEWSPDVVDASLASMGHERSRVTFAGPQQSIERFLNDSALCLHVGRGDAFPLSTLETMCAGVPTIVSALTGTSEVVRRVEPAFVVPPEPAAAASAVVKYLVLDDEARRRLASRFRREAASYTEEVAITAFRTVISRIAGEPARERGGPYSDTSP